MINFPKESTDLLYQINKHSFIFILIFWLRSDHHYV